MTFQEISGWLNKLCRVFYQENGPIAGRFNRKDQHENNMKQNKWIFTHLNNIEVKDTLDRDKISKIKKVLIQGLLQGLAV
jgi:hypothetical protein